MKKENKNANGYCHGDCFSMLWGAFIAMTLSIPFYMDSIGTILVAGLLGPKYAMLTGVLGSITSGITFDMYSFYYAPVQTVHRLLCWITLSRQMAQGMAYTYWFIISWYSNIIIECLHYSWFNLTESLLVPAALLLCLSSLRITISIQYLACSSFY